MIIDIDPVEAIWIGTNVFTLALTFKALWRAHGDLRYAEGDKNPRHKVRVVAALGTRRREFLRVVANALLLSIAIPGVFSDKPIVLSPPLLALILVPVVLLTSTLFDTRDRTRIDSMLVELDATGGG